MADELATTAQVKIRLGIPDTDTDDDALILELIQQASDWISDYTGRKLAPEAGATYTVDTAYGSVIHVPRGIRTVTSLGLATTDQPDSGGTYTTFAGTIVLRPEPASRRPGWPAERIELVGAMPQLRTVINGAKITGDWGFAAVPPAIAGATIDAVAAAYTVRRGGTNQLGADELAASSWGSFFGPGSPARMTLRRYRAGIGIA